MHLSRVCAVLAVVALALVGAGSAIATAVGPAAKAKVSWAGTWNILDHGTAGRAAGNDYTWSVTLTQSGSTIKSIGTPTPYTVQGTASGKSATFTVVGCCNYTGEFTVKLSDDGQRFTGRWTDVQGNAGTAVGTRSTEPPPDHVLAGSVFEQECGEVSCTRAGLAGVTVKATGGPGGPEEVVTGADGTYSLELAEGTWTVTPSLADRPFQQLGPDGKGNGKASAKVTLAQDQSGLDFTTCRRASTSGRLLAKGRTSPDGCKPDLVIESVELTQGIQVPELIDTSEGNPFGGGFTYSGVPLVVGRSLVVRAFVRAQKQPGLTVEAFQRGVQGVPVRLELVQGGRTLRATATIASVANAVPLPADTRLNRVNSVAEFFIRAGDVGTGPLTVRLEVNPRVTKLDRAIDECDPCASNNRVTVTTGPLADTDAGFLRPSLHPVELVQLVAADGEVAPGLDLLLKNRLASSTVFRGAARFWPLTAAGLPVRSPFGGPPTVDVTRAIVASGAPSGRWRDCQASPACALRLADRLTATLAAWKYSKAGVIDNVLAPIPTNRALKDASGVLLLGGTDPSAEVSWALNAAYAPLQELGRQYGLGGLAGVCGLGGFGVDLGEELDGVKSVFGPDARNDVVSDCRVRESDTWVSVAGWTALVQRWSSPGGLRLRAPAGAGAAGVFASAVVPASGAAEIVALVPTDDGPSAPSVSPTHAFVLRDAAGGELARLPVAAVASRTGSSLVSGVLPSVAGAARVELVALDGSVLASRAGAATPPVVSLSAPKAGARVQGKGLPVSWSITGGEGAELTAAVDVSVDRGKTWQTVAAGIVGTSVSIPGAALPRSSAAQLRVRVTDGLVEGTAVVTGLRFPGAAPRVGLAGPLAAGGTITTGSLTRLTADARDDAGRAITGRRLRWLEGTRTLGTGASLSLAKLKVGSHRITLVATDTAGRSARTTVVVRVVKR